jgi:predicted AAA+ superfamily ATPase
MKTRPFWLERIELAWRKRPIIWLAGVRRVGKTTLSRMLPDAVYLTCDLPSTVRRLEDPELFFRGLPKRATVVLDEIHRLSDPTRPLKIAADAFPGLRVLATGSSTLAAARRFRDTLTGRKTQLYLPPILWPECQDAFDLHDLDRRLLCGGLPEPLLAGERDAEFFAEWLDSYYARDIQELFGIRERTGFLNLLRLMLRQSSGLADYSALSRECDLSRPTVKAHLEAMTVACALFPVPPFAGGGRREIVRRPRVYAFDTGFVTYARGWEKVREEDRGLLWEHLVLDVLRVCTGGRDLFYWRDKSGREVDFVVQRSRRRVDAIECKINPDRLDPEPLRVFRAAYPAGTNYLICPVADPPYDRRYGGLVMRVGSCRTLLAELSLAPTARPKPS